MINLCIIINIVVFFLYILQDFISLFCKNTIFIYFSVQILDLRFCLNAFN